MITIERVTTEEGLEAAFALRNQVFVLEQGVPIEIERDVEDRVAAHVLAVDGAGDCLGTGRMVVERHGERTVARIGRMAVLAARRGRGIGSRLLAELEQMARERQLGEATLHAQLSAEPFYARLGYSREGEVFLEAGIEHVVMTKSLRS